MTIQVPMPAELRRREAKARAATVLFYEPGENERRARRARDVLKRCEQDTGTVGAEALVDLIGDLMHLCDQHARFGTFGEALDQARRHHVAELEAQAFSISAELAKLKA